jgi:hypothetical protein
VRSTTPLPPCWLRERGLYEPSVLLLGLLLDGAGHVNGARDVVADCPRENGGGEHEANGG